MNSDVKKIFEPWNLAKTAAGDCLRISLNTENGEELLNWKMKTSKVGPAII